MISPNKFLELLVALRIFDTDYTLSWTSAYLALGIAVCLTQPVTVHVLGLISLIFIHTNMKRLSRHQAQKLQDATNSKLLEQQAAEVKANDSNQNELAQMKSRLDTLTQIVNLKR